MSLDHETSERVYEQLKRDILRTTEIGPQVNISALSRRYRTSATPVREALLRLVGEALVDLPTTGGFSPVRYDAKSLIELYTLNMHLSTLAVRLSVTSEAPPAHPDDPSDLDPPTDRYFVGLAQRSGSEALTNIIRSMNDRLHRSRIAESRCFTGLAREHERLNALEGPRLILALRHYHQRRTRAIERLVACGAA